MLWISHQFLHGIINKKHSNLYLTNNKHKENVKKQGKESEPTLSLPRFLFAVDNLFITWD